MRTAQGRMGLLAGMVGLTLATVALSHAQQPKPVRDRAPVDMPGCRVTPPEGPGWMVVESESEVVFGKKHADEAHTSIVRFWIEFVDSAHPTLDSLMAGVNPATRGAERIPREQITEWEAERDTTLAPLAVRYRYAFEDRAARGLKGRVLVCRGRGLAVVHPDCPNLVIRCDFSERTPQGAGTDGPGPADRFLSDFRLLRPDVVLEPEARFEGPLLHAASGEGALWLAQQSSLITSQASEILRVDPATLAITGRIPIEWSPEHIQAAEDGLWLANGKGGRVLHLDTKGMKVARAFESGSYSARLGVAGDYVWVSNYEKGELWRIQRSTGKTTRIKMPGVKWTLAVLAQDGVLWVTADGGRLFTLDAKSGEILGPAIGVGSGPRDLAWGAGSLWVLCWADRCVQRVDPETRRVVATIPTGTKDPRDIAFHDGSLWVTDAQSGSLTRIDAARNSISGSPLRPGLSFFIVSNDDGLWVGDTPTRRFGRLQLP